LDVIKEEVGDVFDKTENDVLKLYGINWIKKWESLILNLFDTILPLPLKQYSLIYDSETVTLI
jgi:hypothetical protein